MLENKDYCDYETCVALNELGGPITKWISGDVVSTFTLYEAQKFLREEKKIEVNATYDNIIEFHWHWYMKSLTNRNQYTSIINHDSYEQALLAGIKEAVKILTNNKNE